MQKIEANNYDIFFNAECYTALNQHLAKNKYSNIFILTDNNVNDLCVPKFLPQLETELKVEIIEIEAGEENKNIDICINLWKLLTDYGADRKSLLINIGGGVVTDMGGFVASTFKRGFDFINIPTTLLSMVDASVGGKTGVDLDNLKNQIGVINVPKLVLVDINYLSTLPEREILSGLAEMLKHGLIYDKNYWKEFLSINTKDKKAVFDLIFRSIEIKNEIVKQDPTEQHIRKALNFGHTLGHAIESYSLEKEEISKLLHGEAIAIGMILESYISFCKQMLSEEEYLEIKKLIKSIYPEVRFTKNDIEQILEYLVHDKKNEYGNVQFTLIEGIGKVVINQSVEKADIYKAFLELRSKN